MSEESRGEMYALLAAHGVSRRDFVAYCAALAAMLGLAEAAAPRVAAALESGSRLKPVVWLAQGLCTGCTESMAQVGFPDVPRLVLDLLSVNYWETVMAAQGSSAEKAKADTIAKGGYLLVVEGAMMRGFDGNACRIAGKTGLEHLREASANADAIVAVGSCAVDGGWVHAVPADALVDAVGVKDLPELTNGKPIINLPTCPVNPEWVVSVVVDYLLLGKAPALDHAGRPKRIYGATIHENCPRRGHFESGEFVEAFGSPREADVWCLYKLGCKGPQTATNCPLARWNRKASWCVESGSPCIGCGNPDWVTHDAPFLNRLPNISGVRPEVVGVGLGALTLAGLAVHGVATVVSGRRADHGAAQGTPAADSPASAGTPTLEEPAHDETTDATRGDE
jgi:hydrogenase small subunit